MIRRCPRCTRESWMDVPDDGELLRGAAEFACSRCVARAITAERTARFRAERERRAAAEVPPGGGAMLPT